MGRDIVTPLVDEGLGNTSYLVDLGDGRALAVDASRDLRGLRRAAHERRLRIDVAAETHLHADFVSGAVQLAATDHARVVAPTAGHREFPHVGLADEQELDLGGLTLLAMATPGHTGEHLAYVLRDGHTILGIFTGGSLIVGSAARTDLIDPVLTEELARAQYHSLRRLTRLPADVVIWPTHGGGSFCSASTAPAGALSTIGAELATNPLLNAPDEDTFARMLIESLGSYPAYFNRLGEENRRGPAVLPKELDLTPIAPSPEQLIVDVRSPESHATGHPEGALSIPLRPTFASWLGWLAPHDEPLVILRDQQQDAQEILWQAAKIGYTNILGEVAGGVDGWTNAGFSVRTTQLRPAYPDENVRVLDIRQHAEYAVGHVPGALNIELGELPQRLDDLSDVPTVVMCAHGERAITASSVLNRAGFGDVTALRGGPDDWARANQQKLETRP